MHIHTIYIYIYSTHINVSTHLIVSLLVPHSLNQWFSKYYQHSTGTPSKDKYLGPLALPDVLNQNPWEWAQQTCFYKPSRWFPLHTEVENPSLSHPTLAQQLQYSLH